LDGSSRTQEWKALSQALKILTAREDWSGRLIEVWMSVEEEDWRDVESSVYTVGWVFVSDSLFTGCSTTLKVMEQKLS